MGDANPDPRIDGVTNLNNSVYELYSTQGVPDVEVLFFHGLQRSDYKEAYWMTWLSRDKSIVWPKGWLGPGLRNVNLNPRILSLSYDACARNRGTTTDEYLITENLISDLLSAGVGQTCPVVLVGHSLGGIIIKTVLVGFVRKQHENASRNFVNNCKGVHFYSTPHHGSKVADAASSWLPGLNDKYLSLLTTLSSKTARINFEFDREKPRIGGGDLRIQAIQESKSTKVGGIFSTVVVAEPSGRDGATDGFYTVAADHYDVCKPTNSVNDNIYLNLFNFIIDRARPNPQQRNVRPEHRQGA